MRGNNLIYLIFFLMILFYSRFSYASTPTLYVDVVEYVSQVVAYDQSLGEENVTSETIGELGENRTGLSRTNVLLKDTEISGIVNITNIETIGSTTLLSINVTLSSTDNITAIQLLNSPAGNYLVYNISPSDDSISSSNISIYIAELRAGDSVIFNFSTIGTGSVGEPLNFTEEYSSWRVMTGKTVNVTINATNSLIDDIMLYDLEIYKTPEQYARIGDGYVYFNYSNLDGEDSSNAGIYVDGFGRSVLNWNASDKTLTMGETRQIFFDSLAPENISLNWDSSADWATWLSMGNISANFKMNGSVIGLKISSVEATSPDVSFSVSKDRLNETHWDAGMNLSNTANAPLDYNVSYVSVWATKYQMYDDPGNINTWINETDVTAFEFGSIFGTYANATWIPGFNLSQGSYNDSYNIIFNYSLVPIIWSDIDFFIMDDGTQIFKLNQSQNEPNGYLFIEEIYVLLGGYLVKVTKTLTPLTLGTVNNSYQVNITIENIGTEKTPELVSMFDLIPKDFNPLIYGTNSFSPNRSMTESNIIEISDSSGSFVSLSNPSDMVLGYQDTGNIDTGVYQGYWGYRLDFVGLNATSNGNGMYDSSASTKEIGLHYKIAGNTTLASIENAYIVGIDPIRLEGANPSRNVASALRISSFSLEYLVVISSLIVSIILLSTGLNANRKY